MEWLMEIFDRDAEALTREGVDEALEVRLACL